MWTLPEFEGEAVDQAIVVGGRRARVRCGLVRAGVPNPRAGLTYFDRDRVVFASSARGCGGGSVSRVCGYVELGAGFTLASGRATAPEPDRALCAAVARALRPLLARADRAAGPSTTLGLGNREDRHGPRPGDRP